MKLFVRFLLFLLLISSPASSSKALQGDQFADPCGCEAKPLLDVLAIVNGVKIRRQDTGAETQTKITALQSAVINARTRELELQINNMLLEQEARARAITPAQLLQVEVISRVANPTEAEAKDFYQRNKEKIGKSFSDSKADIITLLRNQREQQQAMMFASYLRSKARIDLKMTTVSPPANEEEKNRVFATVNGKDITSRDIEDSLLPLIFNVQQQIYALRKAELDTKINDLLLESEAKKQGLTPLGLLQKVVKPKVPVVSEAQALNYYNENKSRIGSNFDSVRIQIIQYLEDEEERKLSNEYAEQLRGTANLKIFLTAPESPRFRISIDNQPTKGNPKASVTVVEFADFESAECASQYLALEKLMGEYGDRVQFVIRDFPLRQHANSVKASEAAEAAREQNKYWEYAAMLYSHHTNLSVDKLKEYATAVGLDRAKFDAAIDNGRFAVEVQRDIDAGDKLGLGSAPVYFVNGKRLTSQNIESLRMAIISVLQTNTQ